ncbi:YgiW/YdeI family stress tolerance OB fold protein [Pantoea sp. Taur]|uniref:YgiW/YdeI family stress tolerance OB fold protein n=1 Tax=Pantoea sp. Taur TaxID=2576757 RepID=UPI00135579E2|nr:YgiW/YdeI family stress tolerance OB fold protein [Pantoea sp. Taur]MXP57128.1 YgiW/YdeI family stress tolerance OB fold protein [Pantoea sp. Taur]
MKKSLIALALGVVSFGALAQQGGFVSPQQPAAGYNQGGFKGPAPGMVSAAQAKTLRDDSWVVLEGNIVRMISHELYEFRDASGSVNVEIDDKDWMGQNITPNDKVRLEGEVDKDWNSVEIDVKTVRVLK